MELVFGKDSVLDLRQDSLQSTYPTDNACSNWQATQQSRC
jgi:hypothetical protein